MVVVEDFFVTDLTGKFNLLKVSQDKTPRCSFTRKKFLIPCKKVPISWPKLSRNEKWEMLDKAVKGDQEDFNVTLQ